MNTLPPCVLHEDEHLLVVAKPAGIATHAAAPYAGEGIYEWLRHREPRWAALAIVHRLDKDTSGVMVFALSTLASRELTGQFTRREVRKRYRLLTAGRPPAGESRVQTGIARAGDRWVTCAPGSGDADATTVFRPAGGAVAGRATVVAEPLTGRTHQVRVHAAAGGFPVLGDLLYGGAPAPRLCLHAEALTFRHPATGAEATFEVPADFRADARAALRAAFIAPAETDAFRLAHGDPDGWPDARVDRLDGWLLHQAESAPDPAELDRLSGLGARGIYHRRASRQVRRLAAGDASPLLIAGEPAPPRFPVRENGVRYELSLEEGYSTGLFLDQRDNRRRLLVDHVAAGFAPFARGAAGSTLLNVFAYTCAFSVCAALAGAVTTSLDLSRKYLDWGRRNFALNGLDPAAHDFIYGDAFDWLRRLARRGRSFDVVVLDPPTFSQSKDGMFRAERDYPRLVAAALPVLAAGGTLLACTNAARLAPEAFLEDARGAVRAAGRRVEQEHWAAQPPDFPVSRAEPAYLKAAWLRIS